jgi:hypothetical protein
MNAEKHIARKLRAVPLMMRATLVRSLGEIGIESLIQVCG